MKSMNTIKTLVLASALALPAMFAGNAFAIPSCGSCVVGAQPSTHTFVNSSTVCTTCHTASTTPTQTTTQTTTQAPVQTTTTASITFRRTSESCGACQLGTAPSSVSAHKNVNSTGTACSTCHSSSSSTVASSSSSGETRMSMESDDDHQVAVRESSYSRSSTHRRSGRNSSKSHDD